MMLRRFVQTVAKPLAEAVSVRVVAPVARSLTPFVDKFFPSAELPQSKDKQERSRLSLRYHLASGTPAYKVSALRPLRSLGGLSMASYMAIEATEGHFDMLRTWQVDVAKDLHTALGRITTMKRELVDAEDRMEDLEIMVNDLTSFVEVQKDEIARLKAQLA